MKAKEPPWGDLNSPGPAASYSAGCWEELPCNWVTQGLVICMGCRGCLVGSQRLCFCAIWRLILFQLHKWLNLPTSYTSMEQDYKWLGGKLCWILGGKRRYLIRMDQSQCQWGRKQKIWFKEQAHAVSACKFIQTERRCRGLSPW